MRGPVPSSLPEQRHNSAAQVARDHERTAVPRDVVDLAEGGKTYLMAHPAAEVDGASLHVRSPLASGVPDLVAARRPGDPAPDPLRILGEPPPRSTPIHERDALRLSECDEVTAR